MLSRCLQRLKPHVDADALALTGGVALAALLPGSRTRVADVDFVARRMDAVRPSVTRDFLVSHYHVAPDKPIVQLVDPETRLRLDIFPDRLDSVARATLRDGWRIVTAADLLAHKRTLLDGPVDEKHWRDALALAALLREPPPARPPELRPDVYCTDLAYVCARCTRSASADFPIALKQTILDILGYL